MFILLSGFTQAAVYGFVLKAETKEEEDTSQLQSKGLQKTDLYHSRGQITLFPSSYIPDAPVCS